MPGRSWKCRQCDSYNPKSNPICGSCQSPMKILTQGPSTRENPLQSWEQVPPGGYGDGHGGYGTYGAPSHSWKGQAPYGNGPGKGPLRGVYRQVYPGAYGAKGPFIDGSKGKGKGKNSKGNVYILQAPIGPGSEHVYPLGKGGGKSSSKGRPAEEEEEQRDYSDGSPHVSRSPSARRGWAARRLRREESSRSRSRAKHALEEVMEEELEELEEQAWYQDKRVVAYALSREALAIASFALAIASLAFPFGRRVQGLGFRFRHVRILRTVLEM